MSSADGFASRYEQRCREELAGGEFDVIVPTSVTPWPEGRVLCLGGWCDPPAGAAAAVLPNPWTQHRDAIAAFEEESWGTVQWLLSELVPRLNALHGIEQPAAYWDFLIGSWLLHTVAVVTERNVRVQAAHAIALKASFAVRPLPVPPRTGEDAIERYIGDAGNLDLFSRIATALELPTSEVPASPAPDASAPNPAGLAERVRLAARNRGALARSLQVVVTRIAHGRRRGRRILLLSYPSITARESASLRRQVRGLRVGSIRELTTAPSLELSDVEIDWEGRRRLTAGIDGRTAVERLLVELLPALVPVSLVEGLSEVQRASRALYGEPCAAVMGNYWVTEVPNEFLGRAAAAGHRVAFAQHGGGYRQSRVYSVERLEVRPDGRFLSWGWEGPGASVAPSPRLARLRDTHEGGDDVLLVEVALDRYQLRFDSWPLAELGATHDRDLARFVAAAADAGLADRLLLKAATDDEHPGNPGIAALRRTDRARSSYATDWMKLARLAVVTYPATALIEAMVIDVPMIAIWDRAIWEERDDAREHFDRLEALGILFADPSAAARRVHEVYDNASDWWHGDEIQSARLAFLHRFGRTERWRQGWSASLRDLA